MSSFKDEIESAQPQPQSRRQSRPVLIMIAGSTFESIRAREGDFDRWIAQGMGAHLSVSRLDAREPDAQFPDPASLAGIVITGSPAMVTDRAPWSEALAAWLRVCVPAKVPVLGICYGHQLLAHAMGGKVGYNADGLVIGTREITLGEHAADDALFMQLSKTFDAHFVHSQVVLELPSGATLLAGNQHDPHQAFRIGECAWGVQFHPEFSAPVMKAYLEEMSVRASASAAQFNALADQVTETPEASSVLDKFARIAAAADAASSGR